MKRSLRALATALVLLRSAAAVAADPAGLEPLKGVDPKLVPKLSERVKAQFETDVGNFTVEIYPQAAPNAAQRFIELIRLGFYNQTPVFRVVPGFVAQFGINWRKGFTVWENQNFADDPSLFKLDRGTLAFAKAGPNTNSCQVFINYGDNSRLSNDGGFSSFARVVQGMDVVDKFRSVGDPRMGIDQDQLWKNGEAVLNALPEKPPMILKAEIASDAKATTPTPAK